MSSRQLLFRVFYALGFTPWDGHPLAQSLRRLVEGDESSPPLAPHRALDVGCDTGDNAIYLAQHGWQVTGVDFTAKAVAKAREKAHAAGVTVDFVRRVLPHGRQRQPARHERRGPCRLRP